MNNEKFVKTSIVVDRIFKILQGFLLAGVIVSAIFIPLTAILGDKIIADASTIKLGKLALKLSGDYRDYLDLSGIKISIIVTLVAAIVGCAAAWYILCLGAKIIGGLMSMEIVKTWLTTDPLMEEKYRRRVQKVCDINDKHCVPVK